MPKTPKKPGAAKSPKPLTIHQSLLATLPWSFTCFGDPSDIEAPLGKNGALVTIAQVHPVAGQDAEDVAAFIVKAVNALQKSP
jgi:hypothetical protein